MIFRVLPRTFECQVLEGPSLRLWKAVDFCRNPEDIFNSLTRLIRYLYFSLGEGGGLFWADCIHGNAVLAS